MKIKRILLLVAAIFIATNLFAQDNRCAVLYNTAMQYYNQQDWEGALKTFQYMEQSCNGYKDVSKKIKECQKQIADQKRAEETRRAEQTEKAMTKQVVLLETLNGDKTADVKLIELNMVRGEMRKAMCNQKGYQAFTRADIDQLVKEYNFQASGVLTDLQRKRVGEMSGADYICVTTLTKSDVEFYLEAYLIDIKTGEYISSATQYGRLEGDTYANLFQICQDLVQELIVY
ncbi:MAG: hypothetical protein II887_07470 [Bacteroidales bacterium]|nr:hypothetical protein [Bacteroidales bacterium]